MTPSAQPELVKRNRWAKLFSRRRNWLLLWRMRAKQLDVAELGRRCDCKAEKIRALINHPGKVPSASLMKSICQELQANPCELGWTRNNMTVTPFFMVDVTAFMRMLDIMLQGFIYVSGILIGMRKKIDGVYLDYMDRMADSGNETTKSDDADYLDNGEQLEEIISDDSDMDDW